ncbi:MAG: ATP-binding protein [Paludibacteraceae bacterium]
MLDNSLFENQAQLLRLVPDRLQRYLYHQIAWEARLIGLIGPRGVGKTTMILQHIASRQNEQSCLYVSADTQWFNIHSLQYLADEAVKEGITHLYIDEIHKYPKWSQALKEIYDRYPELHIVFTGSSVLDIQRGETDLSRRAVMYHLQGMSFREYAALVHGVQLPCLSLEQVLHNELPLNLMPHPLPAFRRYLACGYYPFAQEPLFQLRMEQVVGQTMEVDIPQYADMKVSTARKLKQMLGILSASAPYKPNLESLAQEVGVSKNNLPDYLVYMERAGLIGLLRDDTKGLRGLGKIEKVYIDNPNLMTILSNGTPDLGNLRETFFYNQTRVLLPVRASREADFTIGEYTFEVGGKKKGQRQLEGVEHGIVVRDEIEIGHANIVPLWAFGLLY